jgi:hypothetical protein
VYSFADFSDIDHNALSVIVNRLCDSGLLVKIGKGKFYKRSKEASKEFCERQEFCKFPPVDKYSIRHGKIKPSRIPMFAGLFYSNRDKAIPLDRFISRVIDEDSIVMSDVLLRRFGRAKVLEVYLNNFRSKGIVEENIEELLNV